jgi:hypothetical protein
MDKRVAFGLAAVLLIAAGFGAGWIARGPGQPAPAGEPEKEDKPEFWRYPKAVREGTALQRDSSIDIATFTTPDDIATVAAWYSERLPSGIPDLGKKPVIPIGEIGMGSSLSTNPDVNVGVGSVAQQGAKVGFGARTSPASAVTVLLSRADGEDRTHIVISFSRR